MEPGHSSARPRLRKPLRWWCSLDSCTSLSRYHFGRAEKASQNIAAAAALLGTLPLPTTPEAQRTQHEVETLQRRAVNQQNEGSVTRRQRPRANQRSHNASSRGTSRSTIQRSSAGTHPGPVLGRCLEQASPACHSETGEREGRTRYRRRGDDDEESRSRSPDAPGPAAFTSHIRKAAFPQLFRPPTNIPKYDGESNPALWLEDYRLACRAGGADDDRFIICNLPLFLADSARMWLENLPADRIDGWADLKRIFVGNFQGTYARPGNPWDLRNCLQKPDESLREYIRRFSRQCNELPNVGDAEVIGAFLSGTTCQALVHKLGQKRPRTTKELLDIATSHAVDEEAVGALFPWSAEGRGKKADGAGEGSSGVPKKKNKKQRRTDQEVVAVTSQDKAKKPAKDTPDHFEKMWNGPCPNHRFPVTHLYKECSLMKKFVRKEGAKAGPKADVDPANRDDKGDEDEFPETNGCLMIIPGPESRGSRRSSKVERREVLATEPAVPSFLRWSDMAITFDRSDHPMCVPRPGRYPLVVDPKVLMDGGSGLNILYAAMLDAMGVDCAKLRPTGIPFHSVVPGAQAFPTDKSTCL